MSSGPTEVSLPLDFMGSEGWEFAGVPGHERRRCQLRALEAPPLGDPVSTA
jgi:hypothetical protein